MINALDPKYGIKADGFTDNAKGFQLLFEDGKRDAIYLPYGNYATTALALQNQSLTFVGTGHSIISAHSSLPEADSVLTCMNIGDLILDGIGLEGKDFQHAALLQVLGANSIKIKNFDFYRNRWFAAFNKIKRLRMNDCNFDGWGDKTNPIPDRGKCLWDGGYAIWMGAEMENWIIRDCTFKNGDWTAINTGGKNWKILDNVMENISEAGIFGGGSHYMIRGNTIRGVRRKDCEANGIEIGGDNFQIVDNTISDTDHGSILLSNNVNGIISRNICTEPNKDQEVGGPPQYGTTGAITLRSVLSLEAQGRNIDIFDNICEDTEHRSSYAVACYLKDFPISHVNIGRNSTGHARQWKGPAIFRDDAHMN